MKRETWYLTPKCQEEKQDVPFIIGGLYKRSNALFYILVRVVDNKYFLVDVSDGETTRDYASSKNEMQDFLNNNYTLVAEKIEVKP